jgi:hypoxanthine phosphoribosyltransferase
MTGKVKVMISEEQVNLRIKEMAEQISEKYKGKSVHLICILKGSVFFGCELAKRLTVPATLDFMSVSSYGSETVSSGRVRILKDLDESIQGKEVIIIEDIIDSGKTLAYLKDLLIARAPKSLSICTLLDKPDRREINVEVDYVGFVIPDEFVVGYGLDYNQFYRNLPFIGMMEHLS